MALHNLILAYVVVMLAGVAGAAIYSEMRRRSFEPSSRVDHIFRCRRCGYVYTDDSDVDRSRCPQCGRLNNVFNF